MRGKKNYKLSLWILLTKKYKYYKSKTTTTKGRINTANLPLRHDIEITT